MIDDHQGGKEKQVYLLLISIHGLIRGRDLELGRDPDTGGQTKYVVELARALGEREEIGRVDLLTRLVDDDAVSDDYAQRVETLTDKVRIVRIEAGPPGYIRKEELWDHLDLFADNTLHYIRASGVLPDVIHSHYADAGYVGVRVAHQLGVPLVHTGHSLGRVKRRRLLASGTDRGTIEQRYNLRRRIEAEEDTLGAADLVITSTDQEIEEQYGLYDYYQPEQMRVVPPGTDLERFQPPDGTEVDTQVAGQIGRFLRDPAKPMILALSRPDERKNMATLVEAYGESQALQETANLVIVAGNRDDIRYMEDGPQDVLTEILQLIDCYDLYGRVAYPKRHRPEDVPLIYRLVAAGGGVFINPALTEPFGLTLIEAAASGLPVVATEDGGPRDIIASCRNGLLIDPLDREAITDGLLKLLRDREGWARYAASGISGVLKNYTWQAHTNTYMKVIRPLIEHQHALPRAPLSRRPMQHHDRAVFADLDQSLLGDAAALKEFVGFIRANRKCATFGIATGRRLESALQELKRNAIPVPDVLITSVGTEIYYAPQLTTDLAWSRHIDHLWTPRSVRRTLSELPGLELQPSNMQSRFKISYYYDAEKAPDLEEINRLLRQANQTVNTFLSFGQYLDIVPVYASKGLALRYFADQWDIPLEHILVAGGSGADEDMLRGNTLAVVVANRHNEELSHLPEFDRIYFARQGHARGILEAIGHYDFYGKCGVPRHA